MCIGYINHIKNQQDILEIAEKFKNHNFEFRIVYSYYNKEYFNFLLNKINEKKIKNIKLLKINNIKISSELQSCWITINTSITEVLPLTLVEANYFGKNWWYPDMDPAQMLKEGKEWIWVE